jgi:hypothetical protein
MECALIPAKNVLWGSAQRGEEWQRLGLSTLARMADITIVIRRENLKSSLWAARGHGVLLALGACVPASCYRRNPSHEAERGRVVVAGSRPRDHRSPRPIPWMPQKTRERPPGDLLDSARQPRGRCGRWARAFYPVAPPLPSSS